MAVTSANSAIATEPIARGLLDARITHARFSPRPYTLAHDLTYLHVPITALPRLKRRFLNRNGWGLFALNDRDYGDRGADVNDWLKSAFAEVGAQVPDGEVTLLTLPRVLGFGFNPVSFWLCHDGSGALIAVLAEVNNTFGERHCYLCRKSNGTAIESDDDLVAEKVFHVSPFLPVDGEYRFRFVERADRVSIKIDLHRDGTRVLSATIAGRLSELTSAALWRSFVRHPFPTLQVVLLIHYHAVRLYIRGHKLFAKPEAPDHLVTPSLGDRTHSITPEQK
jgi:DUF1365 family protein